MGLTRRDDDEQRGRRFQMREKLASIGDDSWIEDENGERLYKVNGKALRIRDTFILEDPDGNEVASIQEKKLSVRDKMEIERGGETVATIHKALVGIRDRFSIAVEGGEDLSAKGNVLDHDYESSATAMSSPACRRSGSGCATPTASKFAVARTRLCSSRSRSRSTR